ncbi:MAG: NAD-dependent epimerase/dehydratase family protein [Bacteroidetes bacterium]|nr:MAG: NAD-dependent epimerase/dehydratase family protein [Bacteroidota bacterium]TAG87155.1 MAG: NAD-dependent epimerase/dehydratase family protein [Bacteroidota bacterium]
MIFITGITGLVGSWIARELLAQNHTIIALKRSDADISFIKDIEQKIEWIEGDIFDVAVLAKAIEKSEYVIHAAAMVSFAPKDRKIMYETNVEGTKNMVNVALDFPLKKFLFISSIAALGRSKNTEIITEKNEWEDSPLNSFYAKTKFWAELEVWRAESEGLKVAVLNPSIVLGEANWEKSSTQLFRYAYQQKSFYPQGTINYIDVKDLAKISVKLLFSDIVGEKFVANAGKTTYLDFLTKTAHLLNKKPPTKPVKKWMGELAWRIGAIYSFFTGKAPLITKETARSSQNDFSYSHQKIKQTFDFEFTPLENTLERVCQELKKRYKL